MLWLVSQYVTADLDKHGEKRIVILSNKRNNTISAEVNDNTTTLDAGEKMYMSGQRLTLFSTRSVT